MTGLEVEARWPEDLCILALRGEARLETVHRLDEAAAEALDKGVRALLIDCTHLAFMDSASAGSLLGIRNRAASEERGLVLYGVPRVIQRLFERGGMSERFLTAGDEAAALALV
jgi:anti-anti-sigma factor